jgi:hypothetical protein
LVRSNGIGVHTDYEVANDNAQIDANAMLEAA